MPIKRIFLFILIPVTLYATDYLSVSSYLTQIKDTTTHYSQLKKSYSNHVLSNTSYLSLNDWLITGSGSATIGVDIEGFPVYGEDMRITQLSASAQKQWVKTGTRFSAESSFGQSVNAPNLFPSFSNPDINSLNLTFTVSQPIGQNAGGVLDQLPEQRSRVNDRFFLNQYLDEVSLLERQLIQIYLDWYQAARSLKIVMAQLQQAESQSQLINRLYKKGAAESIAKIQAQQNLESKKYLVMQSQELLRTRKLAVQTTLQLSKVSRYNFWPTDTGLSSWVIALSLNDALARVSTLPSLQQLAATIEQQKLTVFEKQNKLKLKTRLKSRSKRKCFRYFGYNSNYKIYARPKRWQRRSR